MSHLESWQNNCRIWGNYHDLTRLQWVGLPYYSQSETFIFVNHEFWSPRFDVHTNLPSQYPFRRFLFQPLKTMGVFDVQPSLCPLQKKGTDMVWSRWSWSRSILRRNPSAPPKMAWSPALWADMKSFHRSISGVESQSGVMFFLLAKDYLVNEVAIVCYYSMGIMSPYLTLITPMYPVCEDCCYNFFKYLRKCKESYQQSQHPPTSSRGDLGSHAAIPWKPRRKWFWDAMTTWYYYK